MNRSTNLPLVLAITGASGAVYSARLLQCAARARIPTHIVISPSGAEVIRQELRLPASPADRCINALLNYTWPGEPRWEPLAESEVAEFLSVCQIHNHGDYLTPIASGSFLTRGMVICPCSGSTLSGIVHAASNNLVVRAADVHLKEHRKLLLVPRETPLSVFQLENLHRAAQAGAIVLPASPGWYHGVESLLDLVDFIVARILDHFDIPHQLIRRWGVPPSPTLENAPAENDAESRGGQ
ncbi:UbiX family flavin prenyltransferase [Pirellulaceae bacterium SH449]